MAYDQGTELPLFDFFLALRKAQLPLALAEYVLGIRVLWSGYGLENLDDFRFTLRLLWAKSKEDQERFDAVFDLYVTPLFAPEGERDVEPRRELPAVAEESSQPISQPGTADQTTDVPSTIQGEFQSGLGDELQQETLPLTARAVAPDQAGPPSHGSYQFVPRLPIPRREMASIWRHLRRLRREGPLTELDIEGTIEHITHHGFLLRPILQPPHRNQMRLLMLIDCYESMLPFAPVLHALVDSARSGGLLGRMSVYYFSYVPDTALSLSPSLEDPQSSAEVLSTYAKEASVLIVSDCGSARRSHSPIRTVRTREFLQHLHTYTYRYAWLNPLPDRAGSAPLLSKSSRWSQCSLSTETDLWTQWGYFEANGFRSPPP